MAATKNAGIGLAPWSSAEAEAAARDRVNAQMLRDEELSRRKSSAIKGLYDDPDFEHTMRAIAFIPPGEYDDIRKHVGQVRQQRLSAGRNVGIKDDAAETADWNKRQFANAYETGRGVGTGAAQGQAIDAPWQPHLTAPAGATGAGIGLPAQQEARDNQNQLDFRRRMNDTLRPGAVYNENVAGLTQQDLARIPASSASRKPDPSLWQDYMRDSGEYMQDLETPQAGRTPRDPGTWVGPSGVDRSAESRAFDRVGALARTQAALPSQIARRDDEDLRRARVSARGMGLPVGAGEILADKNLTPQQRQTAIAGLTGSAARPLNSDEKRLASQERISQAESASRSQDALLQTNAMAQAQHQKMRADYLADLRRMGLPQAQVEKEMKKFDAQNPFVLPQTIGLGGVAGIAPSSPMNDKPDFRKTFAEAAPKTYEEARTFAAANGIPESEAGKYWKESHPQDYKSGWQKWSDVLENDFLTGPAIRWLSEDPNAPASFTPGKDEMPSNWADLSPSAKAKPKKLVEEGKMKYEKINLR